MELTKKALKFVADRKAQGGLVGYFIGIMIAVIIALQVTWPVIDDVLNGSGKASIANLSGAAATLVKLIPLFFILTLVKYISEVIYNALDKSNLILHHRISVKIREDKTEASTIKYARTTAKVLPTWKEIQSGLHITENAVNKRMAFIRPLM